MTCRRYVCVRAGVALALLAAADAPALAQVDPLLFMKTEQPNVVFVVDTSMRMQRGASTDPSTPTTSRATSDYYDPNIYSRTGARWEGGLGRHRRDADISPALQEPRSREFGSGDKYTTTTIQVVGKQRHRAISRFEAATRLAIARAAMYQAVIENKNVARFGLVKMRQKTPANATASRARSATRISDR